MKHINLITSGISNGLNKYLSRELVNTLIVVTLPPKIEFKEI